MRRRSRQKRISSRCQTILIARSSLRSAARGHAHPARSSAPARASAPSVRWPSRSPSAAHHPRACCASRVGCSDVLGVADRGAGVGHEHVVERRPRDADRADRHAELGEQPRHELLARGHAERDRALGDRSPRCPKRSRSAAIAASSSSVWICTRSLPTLAFSASGVSSTTISPLVHDRDAVAVLGLVHVVGRQEDRDVLARLELADVAPDRAARLRVEADRRLVEEQHARRVQQAARDLQAPLHAAGERRARGCARRSHRPTISSTWRMRSADRVARDAVELGVEAQVLLGGQVAVERRVLEDEADVAAHLVAFARRRRGRRRARCRRSGARACRAS